jgi:hypothetical protein
LTISEIREEVQKKYYEGQEVILWILDGERGQPDPVKVKIIAFNPNSVLVQRKCWKESYTYFEFMKSTIKPDMRPVIPEKLKARKGAHHNMACKAYSSC